MYVKLLDEALMRILGWAITNKYAQLYFAVLVDLRKAMETLNQCLEGVLKWKQANKLNHNPDKVEVLLGSDLGFKVLLFCMELHIS